MTNNSHRKLKVDHDNGEGKPLKQEDFSPTVDLKISSEV